MYTATVIFSCTSGRSVNHVASAHLCMTACKRDTWFGTGFGAPRPFCRFATSCPESQSSVLGGAYAGGGGGGARTLAASLPSLALASTS